MNLIDFFDQFRNKNRIENHILKAKNVEAVSTIISSFGSQVNDCSDNFRNQDIEYKDLASLSHLDLELLGIKDKDKQEEMIQVFRELSNQDYSLNEVLQSAQNSTFNREIISNATSHIETMALALSSANLKLKISPTGDIIIDEKHFASKFVLDALNELNCVTEQISNRLICLEEVAQANAKFNIFTVLALSMFGLFTGIYFWKKRITFWQPIPYLK